jgi:hypothetical protein
MMNPAAPRSAVAELEEKLRTVRKACLAATHLGDFRAVAKLTSEAAVLNERIRESRRSTV